MSLIKTYMKYIRKELKASEKSKTEGNHIRLRLEMALETGLTVGAKKT